jgi:hypothetical protein
VPPGHFPGKGAGAKCAYKLTLKPFGIIIDRLDDTGQNISLSVFLIFGINIWHISFFQFWFFKNLRGQMPGLPPTPSAKL